MATKKVKLYIQAMKFNFEDSFEISVCTHQRDSNTNLTAIRLDTVEVNIEVPELDEKSLNLAQIEQVRDQIKSEKAESYLRVARMEEHINSLMCLENNTGVNE